MIRFLLKNLRTLGLAFFLAIIVWISAVTAADPNETREYPSSIPIEVVGLAPNLVITEQSAAALQLTLRAPRSILEDLSNHPEKIHAVVDLSGLDAGPYNLPVQISIGANPVRIISQTPGKITLTLEHVTSRTLPLDFNIYGEPAIGYESGDASSSQTAIVISGPQSQVDKVARVQVRINIAGLRESVDEILPVIALDENNQLVKGVTLVPDSVHVTLPISLRGGYKDIAVKVNAQGSPASGYSLTNITVTPPIVTVFSADPNLVDALPSFVETQPIDLQNLTDDLDTRVLLNLPDGVSIVGEQTVKVHVEIQPIQASLTLAEQPIEITNLADGLSAVLSPENVDVILSGPLPQLDTFQPQDLRLYVDAADLEIGTYQLPVQVELPNTDITVESLLPATIEITIQKGSATPTPTPSP